MSLSPLPLPRVLLLPFMLMLRIPVRSEHRRDLASRPSTLHIPNLGTDCVQAADPGPSPTSPLQAALFYELSQKVTSAPTR